MDAQLVTKIAEDIKNNTIPNYRGYLQFVNRYLLHGLNAERPKDPFALQLTEDDVERCYVHRDVVVDIEYEQRAVIIGKDGSGKSTICGYLKMTAPRDRLPVIIDLEDHHGSGISQLPLSIERLVCTIFIEYWDKFLRQTKGISSSIDLGQLDSTEISDLRLFFQHCRPTTRSDNDLLMALLSSGTTVGHPLPGLRDLIDFICPNSREPWDNSGSRHTPVAQVEILVDGFETIHDLRRDAVVQDILGLLHDFPQIRMKLFVPHVVWGEPSGRRGMRSDFRLHIEQGFLRCFHLPPWDIVGLENMLLARLRSLNPDFYPDISDSTRWGTLIPAHHATITAGRGFVGIIGNAAHVVSTRHSADSPIHALKLARGLTALCAGCWNDVRLPLQLADLDAVAAAYETINGEPT